MARIYVGGQPDAQVLEVVKRLADDYWVFAEFDRTGRNVDWFIVRENAYGPSVSILTELKRVSRPLRGVIDGPWQPITENSQSQAFWGTSSDRNPYWQAVNAGNALAEWLWNNQALYREASRIAGRDEFRVWPDVLILGVPGSEHQLPMGPPSRFGRWWFDLEEWLGHIESWSPSMGVSFTFDELTKLAELIGLRQMWPLDGEVAVHAPRAAEQVDLAEQVRALEYRIERLEAVIERLDGERHAASANGTPPVARSLTPGEVSALTQAVQKLNLLGKSRALPGVLAEMNQFLGYSLKERSYNGFGTATAFIEQARKDGHVRYGPRSGPNPTIYLAHETEPSW